MHATVQPMPNTHPPVVTQERLLALAHNVAQWAEREASRQQDLANFDVDPHDLTGMCAIAAAKTHHVLTRAGVRHAQLALTSRWTECHAFVLVEGYRLDPTAMQFGSAGPLVEPHLRGPRRRNPWYYAKPKTFDTIADFCVHLDSISWTATQHPRRSLDIAVLS